MKKTTIEDIAKQAGVSIKTVSRVFNHEPNVKDATREKVLQAAEAMNYRPNLSARSLASNKSFILVHFHENPNPDYLERINQGLHKASRAAGYFSVNEPFLAENGPYAEQAASYLTQFHIDGAILSPPLCDDVDLIETLISKNTPFVRISPQYQQNLSSRAYIDDEVASTMMTEHLIELGHRDIAFITGPENHGSSRDREAGFLNSIIRAGLSKDTCPIAHGDFSFRSGFEAFSALRKSGHKFTAIFAANDEMAVGVMMSAMKAGFDIPHDISIAGFDGSRISDIIWPRLTTIRQPIRDIAQRATNILLEHLRNPSKAHVHDMLPTTLLVRASTASPPS